MTRNQIQIPLCKKRKRRSFGQNHAEHGMSLLKTAFLTAPHGITIVDAGSLQFIDTGFKSFRITKLRSSIREDVFEYGSELIRAHTLFQTVKHQTDSSFCAPVHEKSQKQFFSGEKESENRLFRVV